MVSRPFVKLIKRGGIKARKKGEKEGKSRKIEKWWATKKKKETNKQNNHKYFGKFFE